MKDLYIIDRRFILKARIKALAVEIRTLKSQKRKILRYARFQAETPDTRKDYWNTPAAQSRTLANHLGELAPSQQARWTLLAYAFVRGRSYASVEQKTREDSAPQPNKIAEIAFAAMPAMPTGSGMLSPQAQQKRDGYTAQIVAWLAEAVEAKAAERQAA